MPGLPAIANVTVPAGGQWVQNYTLTNDDGTLMAISGKTFEFVVRPTATDTTQPAEVVVTSSGATAQGYITANAQTSTVQVVLSPTATLLLGQGSGAQYALWMDPGQADATPLVTGPFYAQPVPAP